MPRLVWLAAWLFAVGCDLASAHVVGWRGDGSGTFVGVRPPQQWSKEQGILRSDNKLYCIGR